MQTPSPLPLRNGHIYMKDAHCAETNEKSALSQVRMCRLISQILLRDKQCVETNEK